MLDLDISFLGLTIENARGQEHRVQTIAVRATELLAALLDERYGENNVSGSGTNFVEIGAHDVQMDLGKTGNDRAAQIVADAWLNAIALRLEE